jgi:pyrroloquinoline quinone (PQQ) biosynthesis protein C
LQERALDILQFKLDVLWSMLDSMAFNYLTPEQIMEAKRERKEAA